MTKSFKHKGLSELYERSNTRRIQAELHSQCLRRLEALYHAEMLNELNIPGFNFHDLQGKPKRYSIHVNGQWCITFEWEKSDVFLVDFEQCH